MDQWCFKNAKIKCKTAFIQSFILLISIVFLSVPNVYAEDDSNSIDDYTFEKTMVTATKRKERLQDVPKSITALSEDDLKFIGAKNFSDMMESVAGVSFKIGRTEDSFVAIRGISPMEAVSGGAGSSVGYYLDELPLSMASLMPDIATYDIERIEVLRGPQGTLFGAGSLAGTIRLIANKADSSEFSAYVDLTYSDTEGGDDSYSANAMINVPLIEDKAAIRMVAISEERGGYIDRTNPDTGAVLNENDNSISKTGARMALRLTPSDPLTVDLTLLYSKSDTKGTNQSTKDLIKPSYFQSWAEDELFATNMTIQYDFSFADLLSSTSYFNREILQERDSPDSTAAVEQFLNLMAGNLFAYTGFPGMAYFGLTPPDNLDLDSVYTKPIIKADSFAQELRLVSNSDGPLQWVGGLFYKKHEVTNKTAGFALPNMNPLFTADIGLLPEDTGFAGVPSYGYRLKSTVTYTQYAGFGEISYDFTDKFTVTTGGRYFREERDAVASADGYFNPVLGAERGVFPSDGESTIFNPKLMFRYKFTNDLMTYLQYSKGFRSGGQNEILLPGAPEDYEPEKLTNYEFGLKTIFLGGRARLNLGIYHMEWEDFQEVVLTGPSGIGDAIDNVGDAHSTGADVELALRLFQGLSWTIGGAWVEAETNDDYTIEGKLVPAGSKLPRISEVTYNTALQYNFSITDKMMSFARLSYSYNSESVAKALGYPIKTPAYNLLNFKAGIEREAWQLTLFVNNVLNKSIIYERGYIDEKDDWDTFSGNVDDMENTVSRPRTIGVSFRMNF